MTNTQYLIETVTIKVQTMRERMPIALCGVNWPPVAWTTVCSVYRGLVPRSPNTTPSALRTAHWPVRALGVESCADGLIAITPPSCWSAQLRYQENTAKVRRKARRQAPTREFAFNGCL